MSEVIITGPGSYRTVDGRRVEITICLHGRNLWKATNVFVMAGGERSERIGQVYRDDGAVFDQRLGEENDRIVGPWVEPEKPASPVQEVTTKEIIPGNYGIVGVGYGAEVGTFNIWIPTRRAKPADLRDAARILTELADFIDV
ncbi:hypothetical protein EVC29_076 [Rhizobium phage RHph_Y52]|nr:hypothetical protein EVB53_074 [Rhizobium phage RHph_Y60]QIG73384.1 hypothetical protein EVC03_076 [Rhizobium phage RHph_Y5A]QIG75305.1 hypothetical protein EVC16_076 [Rhizobium phage RHph_Y21]QIG75518.1 hypothetical protein EVC18_076 [Rhizobium phage RHph_Y2_4]QIG76777.1 hypothetical protein EVC29_076 [Rhizobium phage RHph_Y52]